MMNETILGRSGYILKKGHIFPPSFIEEIKTELSVSAKENGYSVPKKFRLFDQTKHGDLILPRYYALKKLGTPSSKTFAPNPRRFMEFCGKLRRSQVPPAKAIIEALKDKGGGLLCLHTGGGKTALALYCAYKLQAKTIVIVNRVELVKQWRREIAVFLGGAKVGEIRGDVFDIANADIVIAVVNTISMKKFPQDAFDCFDFLIVDECHNVASEIFHQCMPKIRTPYTLGLSATPERSDGLMKVVVWFLGDIVFQSQEKINSSLNVLINVVQYQGAPKYATELIANNEKPNIAKMLNIMASDPERTGIILRIIKELYSNPLREVLILGDRKKLLRDIKTRLDEMDIDSDLFVGALKDHEYERAKGKRVILGTYQICGTGFNLPKLNSLIMVTPRKHVEQMIGRILRKQHKIHPVVVDIWDTFSIFKYMGAARMRFYQSLDKVSIFKLKDKQFEGSLVKVG
jgi:superfamily II DNA or RNA helicase